MKPTGETRLGFKKRRNPILEIGRNTKRCDGWKSLYNGRRPMSGEGPRSRDPMFPEQMAFFSCRRKYTFWSKRIVTALGNARPPRIAYRLNARSLSRTAGLSLIELLVVITIIALVSALITTSVLSALNQQNQRVCLNNMLTIEAAKDEYLRDHPGATSIPSIPDFQPYFRFGIPQCPDNAGTNYQNLLSLTQQVYCPKHPENQQRLSSAPSPANN
jgi:prepilin-type N-terminal cleavage/methylation domain-containing protein